MYTYIISVEFMCAISKAGIFPSTFPQPENGSKNSILN